MVTSIDIQIMNRIFASVANEMGTVLQKAAFSPNIKERKDFSCAIFNSRGRLLAQAAHIPVHLGAMPDTVSVLLKLFDFRPGDVAMTNDPFSGGSHLPDITLVSGIFCDNGNLPMFYVAARAHHADIGGATPGSMPLATSLEEEGILIKPCMPVTEGRVDFYLLSKIFSKVRNSEERLGDISAQIASVDRGRMRIEELVAKNGVQYIEEVVRGLLQYGENVMRNTIKSIPDGLYRFEDFLDDDGAGSDPLSINVAIDIHDGMASLDFSESSNQVRTGLNTVRSVTCAAAYYAFFCLAGEDYPVNAGSLRPISIITRKGSLLDAVPPAPVAAGNVETSQRVADVVLGALAKAIPEQIPAAGCGTMNNVAIGGMTRDGTPYSYYETTGGGMGGAFECAGLSGVQVHMTNTLNTPVEVIEQTYPFVIEEYRLRQESGGRGKWQGGNGIVRRYLFMEPATVTILSERRKFAPYGLNGGGDGATGQNILFRAGANEPEILPGKTMINVEPGDRIEIRTPGGGGYGSES